ncbi:MAG: serine protease [Xenococcaceae cyanobacterium MO_188.B29]|nr:serine protease [Xenococcaceae cyanobacterium MO_188.B29]
MSNSSQAKISSYSYKYFSQSKLQKYAQLVTVRVFSSENSNYGGSGVLIKRDGNLYTVLTNNHVIDNKKRSYQIQAPDEKVYPADILKLPNSEDDIGLLVFYSSDSVYKIATPLQKPIVKKRISVMAGGFPFTDNLKQSRKFQTTRGRIAKILNCPFVGGYQIGYTNEIFNGMSGGPVLNQYGELIGINGMGKEPLFGNPYIFQDGSTISETEWDRFSSLSWAIPIQIINKLL